MDNKLKIINCLGKNAGTAFTMRELSKKTKIPYATFYRTLKAMADIILKKTAGKAILVQLNRQNPLIRHYLIISSKEEKDDFVRKQPLISKISSELAQGKYSVILFGSYAKGTQTAKSDIDILVVNEKGERKPDFSRYETIFKVRINPIYATPEEFTAMLAETEENVGKQALKNHVVLYNPEMFWNLSYGIQ